jgi:hypothetical protein
MMAVCRRRATEQGFADRCTFHTGSLDSLPAGESFHAATSLLVSQFITDRVELEALVASAGFEPPTLFHQALLIRAWFAQRRAD